MTKGELDIVEITVSVISLVLSILHLVILWLMKKTYFKVIKLLDFFEKRILDEDEEPVNKENENENQTKIKIKIKRNYE